MTAARLQRYALFLAGFEYKIEYKNTTKHCNADGLSGLPLQQKELEEMGVDSSEVFHANQFVSLPVTSEAVARETRRDPVLATVHESIVKEWSTRVDGDKPYYERRNELTVHQGCILWGMRVVIPNKLQDRVWKELHDGHMGVVKMKALARSYVWWPRARNNFRVVSGHDDRPNSFLLGHVSFLAGQMYIMVNYSAKLLNTPPLICIRIASIVF